MQNSVTPEQQSKLTSLLKTLDSNINAMYFREPVAWNELKLFDYPKIIEHPMDFSTIRNKLEQDQYQSVEEALDDMQLIYDNCMLYNEEGCDIFRMAKRMEELTRNEVNKVFGLAFPYGQKSKAWKELQSQKLELEEFDE